MKFSIIVVCLNPGEKLKDTLESILVQTYQDYEIIVKDGGSKDGSLEEGKILFDRPFIKFFEQPDTGIYDAMNQAVSYAQGEYIFFLNCGDKFHDPNVLLRVAEKITQNTSNDRLIVYGKIFGEKNQVWITPSPVITGFTCYRNVPCHQACFYDAHLCKEKPFEQNYRIRGDYDHFLWCFYQGNAHPVYLDAAIADYEGGGYSETKENLKRSKLEHTKITQTYMSKQEIWKYRLYLSLSLAPIRSWISENKYLAGTYNTLRSFLYQRKR